METVVDGKSQRCWRPGIGPGIPRCVGPGQDDALAIPATAAGAIRAFVYPSAGLALTTIADVADLSRGGEIYS